MAKTDGLVWRKSRFSSNGGNCVEVAWPELAIAVRDSKNTDGPTLAFPRARWHQLIREIGTHTG